MSAALSRRAWLEAGLVVVGFGLVGALAGVVWEWLWSPTIGEVRERPDDGTLVWSAGDAMGLAHQFSGTGWYVAVGLVAGLLAGLVAALVADRAPLLTLAAVVVGSALAAWVMLAVGTALGPPDPVEAARDAAVGDRIPDHLVVSGRSPWTAFPVGALIGLILVFLALPGRRRSDQRPAVWGEPASSGRDAD